MSNAGDTERLGGPVRWQFVIFDSLRCGDGGGETVERRDRITRPTALRLASTCVCLSDGLMDVDRCVRRSL